MDPLQTAALAGGMAWASGIRLYAAGLLGGTPAAGTHAAKVGASACPGDSSAR